jgi:hypothetical protein
MIDHCKYCEKDIPVPKQGNDYWCIHCNHYLIETDYWGDYLANEILIVGNFSLHFSIKERMASIVTTNPKGNTWLEVIPPFPLNELTHELAVQWVNKLKIYVTFQ